MNTHKRANTYKRRVRYRPGTESLEQRVLLTTLDFTSHEVYQPIIASDPISVVAADLDGDGDMDVISASSRDDKLVWYENTDGLGKYGEQQIVDHVSEFAGGQFNSGGVIAVGDIDGDGDPDIAVATTTVINGANTTGRSAVEWYENTDGEGQFSPAKEISLIDGEDNSIFLADMDGDDDLDAAWISSSDGRIGRAGIAWSENLGQGNFGAKRKIFATPDRRTRLRTADVADLDGDGDMDVVVVTRSFGASSVSGVTDTMQWIENIDGTFGDVHVIRSVNRSPSFATESVHAADVDHDGDLDLWAAAGINILFFENTDGEGTFEWKSNETMKNDHLASRTLLTTDVDSDGDTDLLALSYNRMVWFENTDGLGTLAPVRDLFTVDRYVKSVHLADLNGDDDLDAAWASPKKVAWSAGTEASDVFLDQQTLAWSSYAVDFFESFDADGDKDTDLIAAAYSQHEVAIYVNSGGHLTAPRLLALSEGEQIEKMAMADLNSDNASDLLVISYDKATFRQKIVWYDNVGGLTAVDESNLIVDEPKVEYFESIELADIDSDGDIDVVISAATEEHGSSIHWYQNLDGQGTFSNRQAIAAHETDFYGSSLEYEHNMPLLATDWDGDGDLDLVAGRRPSETNPTIDGDLVWYDNTDGKGAFREAASIVEPRMQFLVEPSNLVGDKAIDLVVASRAPCVIEAFGFDFSCHIQPVELQLFANSIGEGELETPMVIDEQTQMLSLSVLDLDDDGDQDIISSIGDYLMQDVVWYENIDRTGEFVRHEIATELQSQPGMFEQLLPVTVADIDGDANLDIVSVSGNGRIVWHQANVVDIDERIPGDADGDGKVAFSDFLILSDNFDKQADAVWADGDFDGDGRVAFADFLILSKNFSGAA